MLKIILILILVLAGAVVILPTKASKTTEDVPVIFPALAAQEINDMYKVGSRFYSIGNIALAVQKREGHNSCGIKLKGQYVTLSKEEGLRLCVQMLGKQLDKADFDTVMKRWKNGSVKDTSGATEKYIADIRSILYQNSYN